MFFCFLETVARKASAVIGRRHYDARGLPVPCANITENPCTSSAVLVSGKRSFPTFSFVRNFTTKLFGNPNTEERGRRTLRTCNEIERSAPRWDVKIVASRAGIDAVPRF